MAGLKNCSSCGKLMLRIRVLMAVPLLILPFYPDERVYAFSFIFPAAHSLIAGTVL